METEGRSLGREDPVENGVSILSSNLAWRIPWTEELHSPGGLHSPWGCKESDTTEWLTFSLSVLTLRVNRIVQGD